MIEDARKELVCTIFYGCIDRILECQLDGHNKIWSKFKDTFFLLAIITPCSTGGQNAIQDYTIYSDTTTQIVTNLWAVQCVVGRVKSRGSWGIIDRSGNFARMEFMSAGDQGESEEEEGNF